MKLATASSPATARIPLDVLDELLLGYDQVAPPAAIHFEVGVDGRIDADRLTDAIRAAAGSHPIARARLAPYRGVERRYHWEVGGTLEPVPLEVVDCPDSRALARTRDDALSASPPLHARTFELTLARGPAGDTLILNLHHAAGDGVGAARLMGSIVRAYADVPDPLPAVDELAVRDVRALTSRSLRDRAERARASVDVLRRWVRPPARIARPAASNRAGTGIELLTLESDEVERALENAPRGATLNDVVVGGLAVAIRRWNERHGAAAGDIHVMVPVNLRPRDWRNDIVGNFAPWASVRLTPAEHAEVRSAAAAAAAQVRRIMKHGLAARSIDRVEAAYELPVGIARHAVRVIPSRISIDTTIVSNLGAITGVPPTLGDAGAIRSVWGSSPGHPTIGAWFSVASFDARLFIGLRYMRAAFDRASARELAALSGETLSGGEASGSSGR